MQARAIGIDLGCTNIKGVLIERDGTILKESKADTNEQDSKPLEKCCCRDGEWIA